MYIRGWCFTSSTYRQSNSLGFEVIQHLLRTIRINPTQSIIGKKISHFVAKAFFAFRSKIFIYVYSFMLHAN